MTIKLFPMPDKPTAAAVVQRASLLLGDMKDVIVIYRASDGGVGMLNTDVVNLELVGLLELVKQLYISEIQEEVVGEEEYGD